MSSLPLVFRLTIGLTMGTVVVWAGYAAFAIEREAALFEHSNRRIGEGIGYEVAARLAKTWEEGQAPSLPPGSNRDEQISMKWLSRADLEARLSAEQLETLSRDKVLTVRSSAATLRALSTFVPVSSPGRGFVEVDVSWANRRAYIERSRLQFGLVFIALVVVNALIAWVLSAWLVGKPVSKLIAKASQVGHGQLTIPIDIRGRDEMGQLAQAMTEMSDQLVAAQKRAEDELRARLAAEDNLRHAERLVTVGKLAAGIAHEIGTPLNVITGRAKAIVRRPDDAAKAEKNATIVREQADRITEIMRDLLDFARRDGGKQTATDIPRLARQTVSLLGPTLKKHPGTELAVEVGEGALTASVDPTQMQQVLTNLVLNALQATSDDGRIVLSLQSRLVAPPNEDRPRPHVCVSVSDDGCGIEPENIPHLFEPFFTTKDVGEGTGLGLSVVYGIVQEHNGWIEVESAPGDGTTFSVFLPKPPG